MSLDIDLTSACRITVLLVPVLPIKRSVFARYIDLIQQFSTIRLSDVTPNNKTDQTTFASQNFQEGQLHFRFSTHYSDDHNEMIGFQPHRRLFGVIGIMHCQEWKDRPLKEGYQQFISSLDKYPSPIVTRCYGFDPTDTQPDDTKGLIMIPSVGDMTFYINTMICDFASEILSQFSLLVTALGQHLTSPTRSTNYAGTPPPPPMSPDYSTASSHSSDMNASRKRKQTPGRIKKLYADFYLLSGRLPDALNFYNQAMDMTRITSDHLWLASAMEGYICTILLLEQLYQEKEIERPATISLPSTDSSSEFPSAYQLTTAYVIEQYCSILRYYAQEIRRTAASNNGASSRIKGATGIDMLGGALFPFQIPSLIYAEACIKVARFLLTVYLTQALNGTSLLLLVQGRLISPLGYPSSTTPPPGPPSLPATPISMTYPSSSDPSISGIQRWDIGQWTTRIWEASIDRLTSLDQILLMLHMSPIYSMVGYARKAAWVKYQSIQLMMPIILCRRDRARLNTKKETKYLANLSNRELLSILRAICDAYSIQDSLPALQTEDREHSNYDEKSLRKGWPLLQMDIVRQCIVITEALNAYKDMQNYSTLMLKEFYMFIPKDEQIRLARSIQRTRAMQQRLQSAQVAPEEQDTTYWNVNLVSHIKPLPLISRKSVHPHPLKKQIILDAITGRSAHKNSNIETSSVDQSKDNSDPFIYNPYIRKKEKRTLLLVKDEIAEFQVSLKNPFAFDLEIQNIYLCTKGVSFQAFQHSTVVPANGTANTTLSGLPKETGLIEICGCFIKVVGFTEQKFLVGDTTVDYQYNVPVIKEQPLLKLKSTSLLQGAIMLFEGERSCMKVTLENIGSVPVDFVNLSFNDNSHVVDHQNPLLYPRSMKSSVTQQFKGRRSPVFNWIGNIDYQGDCIGGRALLPPGATLDITVDIYGQKGCTQGGILVDYGHLGIDDEKVPLQATSGSFEESDDAEISLFFTRQLYIPILITVHSHLNLFNWNLLHLQLNDTSAINNSGTAIVTSHQPLHHVKNQLAAEEALSIVLQRPCTTHLRTISDDNTAEDLTNRRNNYCLATLDIQNRWTFSIQVQFTISSNEDEDALDDLVRVNAIIQPSKTERILLPVKRFILSDHTVNQPEPLDYGKQVTNTSKFLVSTFSRSTSSHLHQQQQLQRLTSLYRSHLLTRIQATWKTCNFDDGAEELHCDTARHGVLDLRSCLHLTPDQMSVLKKPDLEFGVTLEGCTVKHNGYRQFSCNLYQHVTLTIILSNKHVEHSVKVILRVQPVQCLNDDTKEDNLMQHKVLMEGVNHVVLPEIPLHQRVQHSVPIYFLSKGRYEFLYHAQDVISQQMFYDHERIIIDVTDE